MTQQINTGKLISLATEKCYLATGIMPSFGWGGGGGLIV
jgi:hypothetical protein